MSVMLWGKVAHRRSKERIEKRAAASREEERKRKSKMRRGVIQYTIKWKEKENKKYVDREAFVTAVVRELDRVASQSKIEFICVDDAPCSWSREYAKKQLGQWVATKDVEWCTLYEAEKETNDALEALKERLGKERKITPEEALRAVLEDDVEGM